ncbi:uncharacterized protein DMAD_06132 [Drosophila madeirensis]|uniref:Uncharacterized protein n=1 Tax=Drosophila madeirensis TaxID=30013 RepID=A0AAU9FPS1_DROMD
MSNNCRSIGGLHIRKVLLATSKTFGLQQRNSSSDRPPLPLVKAFWKRRILDGTSVIPNAPDPRKQLTLKQPHRGLFDMQIEWADFLEWQQLEEKTAEAFKGKRRKWRAALFLDELTDVEP